MQLYRFVLTFDFVFLGFSATESPKEAEGSGRPAPDFLSGFWVVIVVMCEWGPGMAEPEGVYG